MSRGVRVLNRVAIALYAIIGLLVFTGGYYHRANNFQFEIAQIDPFAWAVLFVWIARRQLSKKWFAPHEIKCASLTLEFIQRQPLTLLTVGTLLYVAFHVWISSWRYDSFHANAFDLSYVIQSLWSTTRTGFLKCSIATGGSYLGEHFSPILAVLSPLYRISTSPYLLFLAQSIVLGGSSFLVYKLARARRVPREWAVVLGFLFLCYQPLRVANVFDFREDNLFVPVFLGAFWLLEKKNPLGFFFFCLLSWTIKENAAVYTALLGLWLALRRRNNRPRLGLLLFLLSAAEFVLINKYAMPYFAHGAQTMLDKRLGGGLSLERLHRFIQRDNLRYALKVLLPFLPFCWASPFVFAIAVLGLGANIAMGVGAGFHYECVLIPFLFYVLVAGVEGIERALPKIGRPQLLLSLALLFALFYGRSPSFTVRDFHPEERDVFIEQELALIPPDVSVTAQPIIHPHLCARKDAQLFATTPPTTDYVVFDLSPWRDQWGVHGLDKTATDMEHLAYQKIVDTDGFLIFKKPSAPAMLSN